MTFHGPTELPATSAGTHYVIEGDEAPGNLAY